LFERLDEIPIAIIELRKAVQQLRHGGGEFGFHGQRRRRASEAVETGITVSQPMSKLSCTVKRNGTCFANRPSPITFSPIRSVTLPPPPMAFSLSTMISAERIRLPTEILSFDETR
jgi:hypothetical protein